MTTNPIKGFRSHIVLIDELDMLDISSILKAFDVSDLIRKPTVEENQRKQTDDNLRSIFE